MRILFGFTEIRQKFGPLRYQHGLASISAVLKQNGFTDVQLAHFSNPPDLDKWEADILEIEPNIIAFYTTAEQFPYVKQLISRVPKGIFTICGGPHPTCYPQCIEEIPRLDAICIGEGEYALLELSKTLQEGKDYTHIKSLWIRKDGDIIKNETRPFINNLNELSYEDREIFDTQTAINKYGLSQIRVMTSRGCPYQCTYCSNKRISAMQQGHYVRYRSADHIMGELNQLKQRYEFKEIFFDDDIFMMNRAIRDEFCERYAKEIAKPFVFCGRVEACNKDMLAKLKSAGGRRIDFGIESGNEDLRRNILKRKMTNQQILNAVNTARSVGLQIKTLNMMGLPDETEKEYWDTVKLNQEIKPDVVSAFIFTPYQGTELYDYCIKKRYYNPQEDLPKGYISRRMSLLNMNNFSRKKISKSFKLFAFRVFKPFALLTALGMLLIYSDLGEYLLDITSDIRWFIQELLSLF